MRKALFLAVILLLIVGFAKTGAEAASGNEIEYQVITTTGVTIINFDRITTEIYTIAISTQTAYVNWTATTPVNTNFLLGISGVTDVIEHTEEVQSSNMSIDAGSTAPVHIRVQWKYWRQ